MKTYVLQSSGLAHAPGIVAWAINGAHFKRDRAKMIDVISKTWSIPKEDASQLVLEKVPYTVTDDNCVTFNTGE